MRALSVRAGGPNRELAVRADDEQNRDTDPNTEPEQMMSGRREHAEHGSASTPVDVAQFSSPELAAIHAMIN
jgi:hypothetical protein